MDTRSVLHNHMELYVSPVTPPRSGDDLKMTIARRDCEIRRLREEVHRLQRLLQEVQKRTANHITLLQQQLTNKAQDIEILQARLQSQHDYVKIKSELSLQSLNQTAANPEPSPEPEVCFMSLKQSADLYSQPTGGNGPAVETPGEFHQDWLSVVNRSSSSMNLQSASFNHSIIDEDEVSNTQSDEVMDHQLDTTRITQQVKEFLQTHNIGQRVFGHCVLGLSQGTVSDILARPKPWSKLTIKGREPFIRMKNFLSDEHHIQTLSILRDGQTVEESDRRSPGEEDASEKIRKILEQAKHEMHLSSQTTSTTCTTQGERSTVKLKEADAGRLDPSSDASTTDFVQSIIQKIQREIDRNPYSSIDQWCPPPGQGSSQTLPVDSEWSKQGFYGEMKPVQIASLGEAESYAKKLQLAQLDHTRLTSDSPAGFNIGLDSSLELDTFSITKRVKDILTVNNLGQRLFGEAVLGLTQSSVSELLSHPKPWKNLSVRGKENFFRLNLWLQDPRNVQKLNTVKMMDEKARLKRSLIGSDEFDLRDHSGMFNVAKRPRVVLSYWEKEALKTAYQREPYPSQHTIEMLASQLSLNITTVSNWFNNYRSRSWQDTGETSSSYESEHTVSLSSVSDTSLLTIKQEPHDAEIEHRDEEHNHVSVGVQSDVMLKREEDDGQVSPASSLWDVSRGMQSSNDER